MYLYIQMKYLKNIMQLCIASQRVKLLYVCIHANPYHSVIFHTLMRVCFVLCVDVFSYDEDDMVEDPYLDKHLKHWGIDIMQMLDVNLRAPMVLTRLAIPIMRAQGAGTVVNVTAVRGARLVVQGS